ncbi:hypothetical protein [Nonomuraea typhae]|uniref:Holin n=1 Tax=Nonomuraea typhae TaxID=2603600 RepID=A0ABW7YJ37_9ACTN
MAGFDTAQILSLVVGIVLPLLVGYVTKESWSGGVKAVILAFLAAVSGFVTEALDAVNAGTSFDWRATLVAVLGTFLVAVGMHYGLYKPTGAAEAVGRAGVKDRMDLVA